MKKLLTPILVLTLIVGFSALALGTVESSGSQTLTVSVQKAYSISAPTTDPGPTVGPTTTDSWTKADALGFKINDTTSTPSLDVAVSGFAGGIELTFDVDSTPSGTANTGVVVNSSTKSGTLISPDGGFSAGDYTTGGDQGDPADLTITFSKVNWSHAAGTNIDLTAVYKFVT